MCVQFICNALLNLEALNVHNDGHVTDDGMAALASLTALTALDLQGNVSITQVCVCEWRGRGSCAWHTLTPRFKERRFKEEGCLRKSLLFPGVASVQNRLGLRNFV
jgi:hypothetical protein